MSTSAIMSSSMHTGVAGHNVTAGRMPADRIASTTRCRWRTASTCTFMNSAPHAAKRSIHCSGRSTIRCTSSGLHDTRATASMTGNPKDILGTKLPSITSRCNQSASDSFTISTSRPICRKSAARREGANIIFYRVF